MDREKLNKAAEEYNKKLGKCRDVTWNDGEYGFIAGTDWLMQQPLSERLTDEEKEIYRNMYQSLSESIYANKCAGYPDLACWDETKQEMLALIFGADLFKEN